MAVPRFAVLFGDLRAMEESDGLRFDAEPGRGRAAPKDHARSAGASDADTEAALVRQLESGSEAALAELFDRYALRLERYAATIIGSGDAARDVAQNAFVAIWERRTNLAVRTTLRAYLFAAVRGHALMQLRQQRADEQRGVRWLHAVETGHAGESFLTSAAPDDVELRAEIERAFAALAPRMREVARLRWFDELSYAEIAETCGTSPKTVENQLRAAAAQLRGLLAHLRDQTK
jgi:RNA polymerase sigma-70 factor (ECF subfamily)